MPARGPAVAGRSHLGDGSQPGADAVRVDGDVDRDPVERVDPPAVVEGGLDLRLRRALWPEAGRLLVAEGQHEVPPAWGESLAQAGDVPLARVQGGPPLIRLLRVSGARILRGVRTDHGGTGIITKAIHAAASSARSA